MWKLGATKTNGCYSFPYICSDSESAWWQERQPLPRTDVPAVTTAGRAVQCLPCPSAGSAGGNCLAFFPLHQNREVARDVFWNSPAAGPPRCPAVPKLRELKEISFMPSLILSLNTERENSTEKWICEKLVSFYRSPPFPLVNIKQMLWPLNFYPLSLSQWQYNLQRCSGNTPWSAEI